jgi:hypothetical protein
MQDGVSLWQASRPTLFSRHFNSGACSREFNHLSWWKGLRMFRLLAGK